MLQPLPTPIANIARHSRHSHAESIDATSENLTYQSVQPLVHKMRLSFHSQSYLCCQTLPKFLL